MSRGGPRNGRPGQNYPNRSDLGVAKLPATAAPGQTYGAAGAQIQSQQQMPMGAQPTPTAPAVPAGPPPVQPGQFGPLGAPTARPDEPVTAGASMGPGPSSVPGLASPPAQQWQNAQQVLSSMAANSPEASYLLQQFQGRGL